MTAMSHLLDDLNFYGNTQNQVPDCPALLRAAAAEINRLSGLLSPVYCFDCHAGIERAGDWYRCFDCAAYMCAKCAVRHFGEPYSPHHRRWAAYEAMFRMTAVTGGRTVESQK